MSLGSFEEDPYNLSGSHSPEASLPALVSPVDLFEVGYFADITYDEELNPRLNLIAKVGKIAAKDELVANLENKMPFECVRCDGELVYPIEWQEASDSSWHIETRCPDCELHVARTISDDEAETFDYALIDGDIEFLNALNKITRENIRPEVERMIDAINNGNVEPMDFNSPSL